MASARSAVAALFISLEGRFAKFESAMQQAAGKFEKFSRKLDKIGNTLTKNLSLPLAGLGAIAIKAAREMDDAFDTLRISTGKTGDELKGLEKSFDKVFTGKAASGPKETAIAISELSKRLGLTGPALEKLAEQMLVVSRLTGTDINSNVKASSQLFNQWGVSVENQSAALDMFNAARERAGIGFDTLLQQLVEFGPVLQTAGLSLTQSTALLAQLEKSGVDTGAAMGGLTNALRTMADKGIKDIPGTLTLMIQNIADATDKTEALRMASELFGPKGGVKMAAAIRSGAFELKDFIKALGDSEI